MSFGGDLRSFGSKLGIKLDTVVRKVVIDMTREIVKLTPVATGLARCNYFWGHDRVSTINEGTAIESGAPSIAGAATFAGSLKGNSAGVFYLVNNLPYIMKLEFGGYHGPSAKVTASGFSTQAPAGMARITVARWQQIVNKAVAS